MAQGLRILLVGEAKNSGRLQPYARAFEKLGIKVTVLDSEPFWKVGSFNRLINHALAVPIYFNHSELNQKVLLIASLTRPDIVLFFKPVLITKETLAKLKQMKVLLYSWYPDDIFYPPNASRYFYRSIPHYDCHFTTKTHNVSELLNAGAREARFLPHAVDITYHYPIDPTLEERARFGADVVFVGTWANDNRLLFLERLCSEGVNVKVFGNLWEKVAKSNSLYRTKAIQNRDVYGETLSRVLNSSKITLAFLRLHNRDKQTARTYEIPACGAFMLHERTEEAQQLFREGEEADYFSTYEELRDKIAFYLSHPGELRRIAEKGCLRARQPDMSYEARAATILSTLERQECAA